MAEEEQSGEKSHEPTAQRLEDARRKGDIPVSRDLSAVAAYLGLLGAVFLFGPEVVRNAGATLAAALARAENLAPLMLGPGGAGVSAAFAAEAVAALAPLFAVPFGLVLVVLFAQGAFVAAPSKLAPKLSRISPLAQARNKFGPTGLAEFVKSAVKLVLISVVLAAYAMQERDRIIGLILLPPGAAPAEIAWLATGLLVRIVAVTGVIAAADTLWQRFDHRRKLRMTYQEVKEEVKRSEGDPHTKSQRRRRAEEIAANRMMLEVPKADVVIVNPTHYAVALRWRRGQDAAPVVTAKGVDGIALRIRETAEASNVPIHSDPPTARALEASVEIGCEVETEHYQAVAAAIRFADKVRARARARKG